MTDVRYRMSLPVIRSLGKTGAYVICAERKGSDPKKALGFYSKYAKEKVFLTDAAEDVGAFVSDLKTLSETLTARPIVIPIGISTLLAMCERQGELLSFADVALPPLDKIMLANDKSQLIPFAEKLGIPVPKTAFIKEGEDISSLAERIKLPAVIKLPRGEMLGLAPDDRYKIVHSKKDFISSYEKFSALDGNILIQQYIEGDGYGVSAVFDKNSEPLEIFCHHRLREYPASGGPSCFCESADLPLLADYAIKLLKELNWVGVAMVEFKGNAENGFYLMEINPRFWGSSALAPNSGCNIPLALCHAAQGKTAKPYTGFSPNYKVGHKMRFLIQDLLAFPAYLKMSNRKIRFFFSFLGSLVNPSVSDGVLSFSDIRSSFVYLKQALKKKDSIVR